MSRFSVVLFYIVLTASVTVWANSQRGVEIAQSGMQTEVLIPDNQETELDVDAEDLVAKPETVSAAGNQRADLPTSI